jgi:hypothetical protein
MKPLPATVSPFLLCSTDSPVRFGIKRPSDNSMARYICQNFAGRWEIEDILTPPLREFSSQGEAALFAHMEGRFYHATVSTSIPSDCQIQIRIFPNFGQCVTCPPGEWVASLFDKDGICAGLNRCSASLAEAKTLGLQLASFDRTAVADQLEWLETAQV